jgi:hypothetical protein
MLIMVVDHQNESPFYHIYHIHRNLGQISQISMTVAVFIPYLLARLQSFSPPAKLAGDTTYHGGVGPIIHLAI